MDRNQKGFTLIELIIVIAVMGIIAAVLVPSFTQMTAKAKVSTDIRSIQMVQSQLDLYRAEHNNQNPVDAAGDSLEDAQDVVRELMAGGYISGNENESVVKAIGMQSDIEIVWKQSETQSTDVPIDEQTLAIQAITDGTATDKILDNLITGTDSKWIVQKN